MTGQDPGTGPNGGIEPNGGTGPGDGPVEGRAGGHGLVGVPDAGAFLARLVRLDRTALVRLRSTGPGRVTLWAHLPWSVLVTRTVAGPGPGDATVAAVELLGELDRGGSRLPARRDAQWRWPLPAGAGQVVEEVPGTRLRQLAAAAAGTLRSAASEGVAGRAVGQRVLRDALLDHVAVVVTGASQPGGRDRVEVSQRLVQAVVRMGFLGTVPVPANGPADGPVSPESDAVQVRTVGRWVGLAAPFGAAWLPEVNRLAIRPVGDQPNG